MRGGISLPVVVEKEGWVGAYPMESRILRIQRFVTKRKERVWEKVVKYDVRKSFADQRLRVKGRFVKKEDEVRDTAHSRSSRSNARACARGARNCT